MPQPENNALSPGRFTQFFRALWAMGKLYLKKRDPLWALPVQLPFSDNFYAVSPRIFRCAQPTARAFSEYEKLGIATVLQLQKQDCDGPLISHTGLKLISIPMRTSKIVDEYIITALKLIESEPGPILVHCRHGADRTGLVMAMYRILFEGWSREEARREMLYGGYGFHHRKRQNMVAYLNSVDIEAIGKAVL